MHFSYSEYYNNGFVIPLFFLIASFSFAVISIINYRRKVKKATLEQSNNKKSLILILISCIVAVIIVSTQMQTLMYGINLVGESAEDAIEYAGEIKRIEKVDQSPRYMHNGSVVRASIVDVGEMSFYFMTASGLKVGDKINITYLPNSTMVLSYELTDDGFLSDQVVENKDENSNKHGTFLFMTVLVLLFLAIKVSQYIEKSYVKQKLSDELVWTKNEIRAYKTLKIRFLSSFSVVFWSMLCSIIKKDITITIPFWVAFLLFFLTYKNRRIIYNNDGITLFNLFGKATIYSWSKITSVVEDKHSNFLSTTEDKVLNITYKRQSIFKTDVFRNISFASDDYIGILRFLKYIDDNEVLTYKGVIDSDNSNIKNESV
ncbi:MAG: hypothetical protein E7675_00235 [Ruminococcaceae bacterium]|nr:hypothetical protein [Oscillospiraceae bacterium]